MEMTLVKSLHKTIKHVLPDYLVTESDLLTAFPNIWMYGTMFYDGFSVTVFSFLQQYILCQETNITVETIQLVTYDSMNYSQAHM
jgi:hypothetical protein